MKVAVIKTMQTMFVGAAAVLTLQAAVLVTPASAQYSGYSGYSQSAQNQDAAITRVFRNVLNREPSGSELRRYRKEMADNGWTERDVRDDLRKSAAHDRIKDGSADRIVKRAWREPGRACRRRGDAPHLRGSKMVPVMRRRQDGPPSGAVANHPTPPPMLIGNGPNRVSLDAVNMIGTVHCVPSASTRLPPGPWL